MAANASLFEEKTGLNTLNTIAEATRPGAVVLSQLAAKIEEKSAALASKIAGDNVAERSMLNYNIMGLAKASLEANVRYMAQSLGPQGIRVNAISAGPIKTLAAAGIGGFGKILAFNEKNAPLRRNVTIAEVGNAAAFLLSPLASGITAEVMYVDAGFNTTTVASME